MRGLRVSFADPAKGSLGAGEVGGVCTAVMLGEDGGDESTGAKEGDDEGERVE